MTDFEWSKSINQYIDALASDNATPGGGSATAALAALGCGLMLMAINTTLKLKSTPQDTVPALQNINTPLRELLEIFKQLTLDDSVAYQKYLDAKKQAKSDPSISLTPYIKEMSVLPANCALEIMKALQFVDKIMPGISPIIISDAHCARHMLRAALQCCVETMKTNLPWVKEADVTTLLTQTLSQCVKTLEVQ